MDASRNVLPGQPMDASILAPLSASHNRPEGKQAAVGRGSLVESVREK